MYYLVWVGVSQLSEISTMGLFKSIMCLHSWFNNGLIIVHIFFIMAENIGWFAIYIVSLCGEGSSCYL